MIYEIDMMEGDMVLFDENGSSYESAALTTYGEAICTIRRWVKRYPVNVGNAYQMLARHFGTSEEQPMTTYYVATHACFVLVDAANTDDALELGLARLGDLLATQPGHVERPIEICTCRPATADEIDRGRWK